MSKPVKNEKYIVRIEGLNSEAQGIARIERFTLFVPGALPGELVRVRVHKVKKNYGYGFVLDVIEPSRMRTEPLCEVFGKCGGCLLQHMDYKAQLNYKTGKTSDALKRIGGANCPVLNTIGMKYPVRYRNKAQFPVKAAREADGGETEIGLYAPRSHRHIPVDDCFLQLPVNREIMAAVKDFLIRNKIAPYNEHDHTGLVRHVITRFGFATGEIMAGLVINGEKLPRSAELVKELRKVKGITSIVLNINTERTNEIMGDRTETLYGQDYITERLDRLTFRISPRSFFQVNTVQAEALYDIAAKLAELTENDVVIDAYCGIGSIALFIAERVKKVWGIDIVPEAIADARVNAELNGITNAEFICGSAEDDLDTLIVKARPDVIFLDPPRKGCDRRVLSAAAQSGARKIIYISCDPATLARDIKQLADEGYTAETAQPVDMFAQTGHVETVVVLQRSGT